jgi:hypothetical protein
MSQAMTAELDAAKAMLIAIFERISRREPALLKKLLQAKGENFSLSDRRWSFTLPALYCFLRKETQEIRCIEYEQFRRLLLTSPLNRHLAVYGARIVIARNERKVDRSIYALEWLDTSNTEIDSVDER